MFKHVYIKNVLISQVNEYSHNMKYIVQVKKNTSKYSKLRTHFIRLRLVWNELSERYEITLLIVTSYQGIEVHFNTVNIIVNNNCL